MRSKGFTLIELLVVIAIIGVLAGIILVSLSTAKSKGNEAAIKANFATIQVQATLYYSLANTYGSLSTNNGPNCSSSGNLYNDPNTTIDDVIGQALAAAQKSALGGETQVFCRVHPQYYLFAAKVGANPNQYWCIDSKGNSRYITTQPTGTRLSCD